MGFSRQEYWMGSHALLQGIFLTLGLNPGLPHCRRLLYHLNHQGSPGSLYAAAAAAKSRKPCPTLCDPVDGSPPGSTVPGILQARTLEWVPDFLHHQISKLLSQNFRYLHLGIGYSIHSEVPKSASVRVHPERHKQ